MALTSSGPSSLTTSQTSSPLPLAAATSGITKKNKRSLWQAFSIAGRGQAHSARLPARQLGFLWQAAVQSQQRSARRVHRSNSRDAPCHPDCGLVRLFPAPATGLTWSTAMPLGSPLPDPAQRTLSQQPQAYMGGREGAQAQSGQASAGPHPAGVATEVRTTPGHVPD